MRAQDPCRTRADCVQRSPGQSSSGPQADFDERREGASRPCPQLLKPSPGHADAEQLRIREHPSKGGCGEEQEVARGRHDRLQQGPYCRPRDVAGHQTPGENPTGSRQQPPDRRGHSQQDRNPKDSSHRNNLRSIEPSTTAASASIAVRTPPPGGSSAAVSRGACQLPAAPALLPPCLGGKPATARSADPCTRIGHLLELTDQPLPGDRRRGGGMLKCRSYAGTCCWLSTATRLSTGVDAYQREAAMCCQAARRTSTPGWS